MRFLETDEAALFEGQLPETPFCYLSSGPQVAVCQNIAPKELENGDKVATMVPLPCPDWLLEYV